MVYVTPSGARVNDRLAAPAGAHEELDTEESDAVNLRLNFGDAAVIEPVFELFVLLLLGRRDNTLMRSDSIKGLDPISENCGCCR